MQKSVLAIMTMAGLALGAQAAANEQYRRLPVDGFRDRLKGGWIGQMAGVGWGSPTELKAYSRILPESEMPPWDLKMVNQHRNDDIYVELSFVRSMELYGLDVSTKQAGMDFANTGFSLFCANFIGRNNVRCGIAPPDSGHPHFTHAANDLIDYQIESDFSGLISPGCPNSVIALGEKFGHMMCYGDGVYAGQFVGGMYAEAYFEKDVIKVIEAGLKCIPAGSQYAEMVRDMLGWHKADAENWEKTWGLVEEKYHKDTRYHHRYAEKSIEVKLNGAYILMGLLYGKGDMEKTIQISTRCGQDSDCNPANAGGVLGAILGFTAMPERFKSALDEKAHFFASTYNWPEMIRVHEKLARQVVVNYGGRIEKDAAGREQLVILVQAAKPGPLEKTWEPGPVAGVKYSDEEVAKMMGPIEMFAPGWKVKDCGGPVDQTKKYLGRDNVLQTHPLNETTPCILYKTLKLPAGKKSFLCMDVGHRPNEDWDLRVKADGKELLKMSVDKQTTPDGWMEVMVDLTEFSGKTVKLELLNQASGWSGEMAYWSKIAISRGVNLLKAGKESRSRQGNRAGSINDGEFATFVCTYGGKSADEDWFAVTLEEAVTIGSVAFGHGQNYPDGGWFDASAGKPKVQVQLVKDGVWETVGELGDYPKTTAENPGGLTDGQMFTCDLAKPVMAVAVRVIGKPAGGFKPGQAFSSCSELQAFAH